MDAYAYIIEDLQRVGTAEVSPLSPPFDDFDPFEIRFEKTFASLQRSVRQKSRILALTDAYYLGSLLNQITNRMTRRGYAQLLTEHYLRMVENTFDLFEFDPEQINRTQQLNVQQIRKVPRPIVRAIRDILLIPLAGAQE
jgi:hypothetical protein